MRMRVLKLFKYIKENRDLKYLLFHLHRPKQIRPYRVSYKEIVSIFQFTERKYWYNIITPLLWDICPKENGVLIADETFDTYPYANNIDLLMFNIEDLKKTKFDIEPGEIYTHKKYGGLFVADSYIPLDKRYISSTDYNLAYDRAMFGSIVTGFGISNDHRTYGFECGHHYLNGSESFYSDYEKTDFVPKEGTFLYYIQKMYKKELTPNWDINEYKGSIYEYAYSKEIDVYDTEYRTTYESFFKEFCK